MSRAGVIIVGDLQNIATINKVIRAAQKATFDELIVVVERAQHAQGIVEEPTVLLDESEHPTMLSGLRVALDWCAREHHDACVVALVDEEVAALDTYSWQRIAEGRAASIVVGERKKHLVNLFFLDASAWALTPLQGSVERLWEERRDTIETVDLDESSQPIGHRDRASNSDVAVVEELLGRPLGAAFTVAVRDRAGVPLVIKNAPFLDDGTPMPTTYWLVGKKAREAVGRLEANGGVKQAEAAIDASEIEATHDRYRQMRDALIQRPHDGPLPSGGVGGTRIGIKCLHAHLAYYLAGGGDPVGRWVAHVLMDEIDGPVAAVDCGTNSTRLLIADQAGTTLERAMHITRLGQDVDRTGALVDEAIERTVSVLREYRRLMDDAGVVALRAVATSAVRDAVNGRAFLVRAGEVLGVVPELLSGQDEGQLSYAGATAQLLAGEGPYLVVDLGGGSTELIAGEPGGCGRPSAVVSLPVGCVRVSERFLVHDPPLEDELEAARSYVGELTDRAVGELPALVEPRVLVGVAGTVSALASLCVGAATFDEKLIDRLVMSRRDVTAWLDRLAAMVRGDRLELRGLELERADVIVGGALILDEMMKRLGYEEVICSVSDILDGIVASLLAVSVSTHKDR